MTTEEMVAVAAANRDEWAAELRDRLVGAIFDDVHHWLGYWGDTPEDIDMDDFFKICQMMEISVGLDLFPVDSGE